MWWFDIASDRSACSVAKGDYPFLLKLGYLQSNGEPRCDIDGQGDGMVSGKAIGISIMASLSPEFGLRDTLNSVDTPYAERRLMFLAELDSSQMGNRHER